MRAEHEAAAFRRWVRAGRGWLRSSARERQQAAKVLLLWLRAEVCLRAFGLPRVCRLFGVRFRFEEEGAPSMSAGCPDRERPEDVRIRETVRRVDRVLRVVKPEGACLRRALVLGSLLRDLSPLLRLGVVRSAHGIQAHAWLELEGRSLPLPAGAPASASFVPLRPLGMAGAGEPARSSRPFVARRSG